jgi:uncharacterized protein with GYD domain
MIQASYKSEALAELVKNPADRTETIRHSIEQLGGKLEGFWLSFGEYDVVGIVDMPDNVTAAAFSIAASAGGALKAGKTTPLFTTSEGVEAMKKAAVAGYRPPGS